MLYLESLTDDIIEQGKDLGVYFYIYTGGEPLVRKKDVIRLAGISESTYRKLLADDSVRMDVLTGLFT